MSGMDTYRSADATDTPDPITGLYSVAWLLSHLGSLQLRYHKIPGAILSCQVQSITSIHTSFGHQQEAEITAQYADWLRCLCPEEVILAGTRDSQVLIYIQDIDKRRMEELAYQISDQPPLIGVKESNIPVVLASSIGAAYIDDLDSPDPAGCIRGSLSALKGCQLSRAGYQVYCKTKHQELEMRAVIARDLAAALQSNHIYFALQPQFNIETQALEGAEMLMRWHHLEYGPLSAQTVVDVAESTQQILYLGQHALRTALEHLRRWKTVSWIPNNFRLAINVSAAELETAGYIDNLSSLLIGNDDLTQFLELEITESLSLGDLDKITSKIERLKAWGIQVALDDFGTSHANLHHLAALKVSTVKLDRSFINSASYNHRAEAVCKWVPQLADELGIRVVAEGVETDDQLQLARRSGAGIVQGYHLAEPMGLSDFENLLVQQVEQDSKIPCHQLPLLSA
ncbi:MAG: EAL domain-containing protein [Gammaproteobacteria bacterium]|nr:EAL domain-containing protein [Gammaproteobacteria bacterium]